MSNDIDYKIQNLISITKPFKNKDMFVLFQDHNGWSNGFIADLKGYNIEALKAKAQLQKIKNESFRYTVELDKCPKVTQLIPDEASQKEVTNIELDLMDLNAWLIADSSKVKINYNYLRYFADNYKNMGQIHLKISEPQKPVTVWLRDQLIGLIMPIHTD